MKTLRYLGLIICFALPCSGENYLLNGGQSSEIDYHMVQEIVPATGTGKLVLSYVEPASFKSPSYKQNITHFDLTFSSKPHKKEEHTDLRGNRIVKAYWFRPTETIRADMTIRAENRTDLVPLKTKAPFPVKTVPRDTRFYLEATRQVPVTDPAIRRLAEQLTRDANTQFDAVQQILTWIVDHITYELRPKSYEAMYAINTGRGNCQNYSHVAAALMRAVGIPVRIVNGVTLQEPYHVKIRGGYITMRMAQGRHSWIEIYFSDLGWVPFDPQQMQLFVSNRFIRVEVGLDNEETVADGTVLWSRLRGTTGTPRFQERIEASFASDAIDLFGERQPYGPRKLLFSPPVQAAYTRIPYEASETAPEVIPNIDLDKLVYDKPLLYGNLDFPRKINFLDYQPEAEQTDDTTMVLLKNFLVETSEYVTTQGQKYAQAFTLSKPVELEKAGLALQKFGGSGHLWIDLMKDDGEGGPGATIAASAMISTGDLPTVSGYDWVDFPFTGENIRLSPGRYWIALSYTGSPIVNWFFTYGKPTGPADGTRYKALFDKNWDHNLTYEFNYRIEGKTGAQP